MEPKRGLETEGWSSPLEATLGSWAPLREAHLMFLRKTLGPVQVHAIEEVLIQRAKGEALRPLLIASGWAAAVAHLEDGRRQIVSLFLPGDVIDPELDLQDGLEPQAMTTVRGMDAGTLTATLSGDPNPALKPLTDAWASVRREARSRLIRHIIRLGRLSAYERTADLFLELHQRLRRAGVAEERGMPLPLTQEMLADHLGLSVVHMNRTLQQLRRDGLIANRGGQLVFPDRTRLMAATRRLESAA
jgi:CRP-like cAMP-binding protein